MHTLQWHANTHCCLTAKKANAKAVAVKKKAEAKAAKAIAKVVKAKSAATAALKLAENAKKKAKKVAVPLRTPPYADLMAFPIDMSTVIALVVHTTN